MQRIDAPEILDSDACSPREAQAVLTVLGRINRWFGGVRTTHKMVAHVAQVAGIKQLSLLEVAAGSGQVPDLVRESLSRRGIAMDVTLLDLAHSHLPEADLGASNGSRRNLSVVADALALPFADGSFDVVSCSLFAHHLDPLQLKRFAHEALRVSRRAVLINDLVRHPLHLALAYMGYPIMRNRVAWLDGLTSVRRAYVPREIQLLLVADSAPESAAQVDISRRYLFRMGVIFWKQSAERQTD
ncbi:MAG: methyltransferase domain-containing protein [Candidatus Sulfotelmatobacter sp.]